MQFGSENSKLLYIYDYDEEDFTDPNEMSMARVVLAIGDMPQEPRGGTRQLLSELDHLVGLGETFDTVKFFSHGHPGSITFQGAGISETNFFGSFAGRKYEKLFPEFTRIHFDGCNVGKGDEGWDFMQIVGQVLLAQKGGIVFAYTTYGIAGRWGSGIHHFFDDGRRVEFESGGLVTGKYEGDRNVYAPPLKPLPNGTLDPHFQWYDQEIIAILERRAKHRNRAAYRNKLAALGVYFKTVTNYKTAIYLKERMAAPAGKIQTDKLARSFRANIKAVDRPGVLALLDIRLAKIKGHGAPLDAAKGEPEVRRGSPFAPVPGSEPAANEGGGRRRSPFAPLPTPAR